MPEEDRAMRNKLTELSTRLVDLEEAARVARCQLEGIEMGMADLRERLDAMQTASPKD